MNQRMDPHISLLFISFILLISSVTCVNYYSTIIDQNQVISKHLSSPDEVHTFSISLQPNQLVSLTHQSSNNNLEIYFHSNYKPYLTTFLNKDKIQSTPHTLTSDSYACEESLYFSIGYSKYNLNEQPAYYTVNVEFKDSDGEPNGCSMNTVNTNSIIVIGVFGFIFSLVFILVLVVMSYCEKKPSHSNTRGLELMTV